MKRFGLTFLMLFFLILAAWPLFGTGFIPTHDGEYHVIRFIEFWRMLSVGNFFPRWAPNLNSGYGVPLFNFFYPMPNYIGAFWHLFGLNFVDSFKLVLATAYLGANLFCFLWLKKIFNVSASVIGTIIFAYVPYWFVDIYVRGSVGEALAIAWLMLAMASIEYRNKFILVFAVAGLILSHNILTMIFLPLILVYMLFRKSSFVSLILGIGLATYFWLPALIERPYVVGLNTVNFKDHFPGIDQLLVPSWGTGFSNGAQADQMSFQIGILPLFISMCLLILSWHEDNKQLKKLCRLFILVAIISFGLMLKQSQLIWDLIPILPFMQYPWRLLSLWLPVSAFSGAYLVNKTNNKLVLVVLILSAVGLSYIYSQPVVYQPRTDEYYLSRREFTDGTSSLGNTFSTKWSAWKEIRPKAKIEFIEGTGRFFKQRFTPLTYEFYVEATSATKVRINVLYYPGWQVSVGGKREKIDYQQDGTLIFQVLEGVNLVKAEFKETRIRKASDMVSLLSLFCLIGWFILERRYADRNRYNTSPK